MENLGLVPQKFLQELQEKLDKILALQDAAQSGKIPGYVGEEEAQKMLGRGTTWLWEQRSEGRLHYSKIGSRNFYALEDIKKFLDDHRK